MRASDLRLGITRPAARARLLAHMFGGLGPRMVGMVVVNSVRRRRALRVEQNERNTPVPEFFPGALLGVEPHAEGARFGFARAELDVRFLRDDVVRLDWGPGPDPVPYALAEDRPWPAAQLALMDRGDRGWVCISDLLEVQVTLEGAVVIARRDGTVLRRTAPPKRVRTGWKQEIEMRPFERFAGLGEQTAAVDLRGGRFRLWNTDAGGAWGPGSGPLYMAVPLVVATHDEGDLLTFYENSTYAEFAFGESQAPRDVAGRATVQFAGGRLRYYVMSGEVPDLLDRYTELTGRPSLPPRWALGYHQSRWGYRNESDVRRVVDGYRREGLPLSALHLDIDYMDGYRVFTVDSRRFPDLSSLCAQMAREGVRIVTIVDPGVKVDPGYELYRQGIERRMFLRSPSGAVVEGVVWPGRAVFPDFTDALVRRWWAGRYERLTGAGVSGMWHDMNEPASIALAGDPTLPSDTLHSFDGRGGDHGEGHNLYGLLMNRSGFEGLSRALPDRRPFIVSRSGWASNQRWAWNWTGDADSSWAAMRQQMSTLIGLGLSGGAFSGSDIGGFSGVPDDELYLRWLQMSVFMGFCRTHSVFGAPAREPWRFGEPTRSLVGAWIRFRYRLLPYLYTLAHEASASGAPLVRPLWWPSASEHRASGPSERRDELGAVDDQFLLGECLLVAPVVESGARTRRVVLPPGRWEPLWRNSSGAARFASGVVEAPSPPERPPVYVRSGAVVPLDDGFGDRDGPCRIDADEDLPKPGSRSALGHEPRLLAFHCWPNSGGEASGHCFDDDGDGFDGSRHDEIRLSGARSGEDAVLTWTMNGSYAPPERVRVVVHGFDAQRVLCDGRDVGSTSCGAVECPAFESLELRSLTTNT